MNEPGICLHPIIEEKWRRRFMALCEHIAEWSKDPSTKVGAVIVNYKRQVVGMGYNGFPRGVKDSEERYADRAEKYPRVVHAEMNAILNASANVKGCSLFTSPLNTCARCATFVIQAGIKTVYASPVETTPDERSQAWLKEWNLAQEMYYEAGVSVYYL